MAVLALVAALAPAADASAFGIHEHLAVSAAEDASVIARADHGPAPEGHHCDLSVSPAADVWRPVVPAPVLLAGAPDAPPRLAPRFTPRVPVVPPRA
jgi:hypothetical protein